MVRTLDFEIKYDDQGNWGLLESFNKYDYPGKKTSTSYTEVVVGFDGDNFVEPYLKTMKNGFVSLSHKCKKRIEEHAKNKGIEPKDLPKSDKIQIRKETVHTYVLSKDPFFSMLGDCLPVVIRVYMDKQNINNPDIKFPYFPKRTEIHLYKPISYDTYVDEKTGVTKYMLNCERIEKIPEKMKERLNELVKRIAYAKSSRYAFLDGRVYDALRNSQEEES